MGREEVELAFMNLAAAIEPELEHMVADMIRQLPPDDLKQLIAQYRTMIGKIEHQITLAEQELQSRNVQ